MLVTRSNPADAYGATTESHPREAIRKPCSPWLELSVWVSAW